MNIKSFCRILVCTITIVSLGLITSCTPSSKGEKLPGPTSSTKTNATVTTADTQLFSTDTNDIPGCVFPEIKSNLAHFEKGGIFDVFDELTSTTRLNFLVEDKGQESSLSEVKFLFTGPIDFEVTANNLDNPLQFRASVDGFGEVGEYQARIEVTNECGLKTVSDPTIIRIVEAE